MALQWPPKTVLVRVQDNQFPDNRKEGSNCHQVIGGSRFFLQIYIFTVKLVLTLRVGAWSVRLTPQDLAVKNTI